jgi:hypothetical protein
MTLVIYEPPKRGRPSKNLRCYYDYGEQRCTNCLNTKDNIRVCIEKNLFIGGGYILLRDEAYFIKYKRTLTDNMDNFLMILFDHSKGAII